MSTAALINDVSSPTTASRAAGERALPAAAVTRYARTAPSSSLSAAPAARTSSASASPRCSQPRASSSRSPATSARSSAPKLAAVPLSECAARYSVSAVWTSNLPASPARAPSIVSIRRASPPTNSARTSAKGSRAVIGTARVLAARAPPARRASTARQQRPSRRASGRFIATRGQQDDRHRRRGRVAFEPPTDLVTVHLRHHHIHEDDLGRGGTGEVNSGGAGGRGRDLPARGELERAPHEHEEVRIIVDDQRPKGLGHGLSLLGTVANIGSGAGQRQAHGSHDLHSRRRRGVRQTARRQS